MEHTNFEKFIERHAKVEHGDLGVGDLFLVPMCRNRSESANTLAKDLRRSSTASRDRKAALILGLLGDEAGAPQIPVTFGQQSRRNNDESAERVTLNINDIDDRRADNKVASTPNSPCPESLRSDSAIVLLPW